jgi:hypothetical protein
MAVDVDTIANLNGRASPVCIKWFSVAECTTPADALYRFMVRARAYPVDPATPVAQSRFDSFPATTVRMVAFGSIPVQATVHLSLPLDSDGLPVPLLATGGTNHYAPNTGPEADKGVEYEIVEDSDIAGQVELRVSDVSVDGVPVEVGSSCRTDRPARLTATGNGYYAPTDAGDSLPPAGKYNPRTGGTITGTLDVPDFTGCGTSSDDLDPLMTAMASGVNFPVTISQGLVGDCWASPPTAINPRGCGDPAPLAFPARGSH